MFTLDDGGGYPRFSFLGAGIAVAGAPILLVCVLAGVVFLVQPGFAAVVVLVGVTGMLPGVVLVVFPLALLAVRMPSRSRGCCARSRPFLVGGTGLAGDPAAGSDVRQPGHGRVARSPHCKAISPCPSSWAG
ncbi:hypothetical protein [Rathayibacter toxicus]|uniref:hypothetical protein n=1 Tax=Rathayibacter toxicus TaxID=145458 RepID=UPI000CE81B49|nr:hypothetical protein [Rathayibacter toxicus]PPI54177.1 hypothetical protein C5D35_07590 [Rathayibacter toxicus]QOD11125.1 hypothetical protein BSG36_03995 [Rathayibacter toxicus]QWL27868.1 hypothetical protein E2R33_04000 [Rathayibacter toxicus]